MQVNREFQEIHISEEPLASAHTKTSIAELLRDDSYMH